jgi:hypothetical protein
MSDINLIISATDNASGPLGNINNSLNNVKNNANNTGGAFGGMGGKMKAALGVAGAAFAAFKGISVVNDKIADMDELAKRARAVGSASEEGFAKFQVASQLLAEGGLSAQEADRAFNNLQLRMAAGAAGNKAYAEIMAKLGDSVKDSNGDLLEAPGLFEAVGQAVQDGTLSIDEASKVLGQRVGPKIVGIFEDLADKGVSTKDALADVAANTNIVSLEAATNAEAFGDLMERIKQVLGKLMTEAITPLLPLLVKLAENVLAALPPIVEKVQRGFEAMEPVFALIGKVLTDVVFPIIGLLADGFIALLEAIGPVYEAALPALEKAITVVKDVIEVVVEKVMGFIDSIKEFGETVSSITGGVKDKVGNMASGVADSVSQMSSNMIDKAKEASDGVLGWFQNMYHEAVGGSIIPDMVDEILIEFDRQTAGMTEKAAEAARGVLAKFKGLEGDLPGVLKDALAGGFGSISEEGLSDIEYFTKAMEDLEDARKKEVNATRRGNTALSIMDGLFKQGNVTLKQYAEMYDHLGIKQTSFTSNVVMSAKQIADGFGQMSSTIASTMTDVIMGTKNGFEALGDIVNQVVRMIVNTLVQNFIVSPLIRNIQSSIMGLSGSSGGGLFGSLLGGLGGLGASTLIPGFGLLAGAGMLLGGLFADGGNTARAGQKPILVGERGPEIFLPGKAGTVVSNEDLNSMGGQGDLNVSFTINAIDTQTGVQFLLENKRVITGVIQEAYMRRGTSGPLG